MPEKLEKELRQQAIKRRLSKKHQDAYVYGTMRKTGWRPKGQEQHGNKYSKSSTT